MGSADNKYTMNTAMADPTNTECCIHIYTHGITGVRYFFLSREAKSNDGVSKLAGSAVESQSSAINISVERNLTFDELDEKFYEILRHKLNVNIRKGAAGAARSSGTGNLDRSRSQSVEAQGTVKVHVQKEEDMETENQAAGNLESNQNAAVDATYDEYQTQLREGDKLEYYCFVT